MEKQLSCQKEVKVLRISQVNGKFHCLTHFRRYHKINQTHKKLFGANAENDRVKVVY